MKLVKLSDIFTIEYGNSFALQDMNQGGEIAFISRGESNNGVVSYVYDYKENKPFDKNKITVSLGGSVLESFLQEECFYTSYHIKVLTPKLEMSKQEMLAYCAFIRANKYRYSYGRQANKTLGSIKIPSLEDAKKLLPKINIKEPSKKPYHHKKPSLSDREWSYFKYKELCNIQKGERLTKSSRIEGNTPLITAKSANNGMVSKIDKNKFKSKKKAI